MRSKIIAGIASIALAATLCACVPGPGDPGSGSAASNAKTVDVAEAFSRNGIAIVPFVGGDPVRPVEGETVLVVTDWQVQNMQAGMRESGATIGLDALDAAADALKENDFDPGFSPSQLILAWWLKGESARADLARAAYPAPAVNAGYAVPLYVLALFQADALEDAGRTDAAASVTLGTGETTYALGADSILALDACGAVAQTINDVNSFLVGVGAPPRVIGSAVDAAYGIVNGLTGGALDYFYKVVGLINAVMSVGSLITPWKIEQKLTADVFAVGLNGKAGDGGVLSFSITGVVGQPPTEVKSCLSLFGLKDPTSLEGTTFNIFANPVAYSPRATVVPSFITVDEVTGQLDENNTASVAFGTGMQTIDEKDTTREENNDAYLWINNIQRSDVGEIEAWLKSAIDNVAYKALFGGVLDHVASLIEVAANPMADTIRVPVSYLVPKDPKDQKGDPVAGPGQGNEDGEEDEAIGDCLPPSFIEQISGQTVIDHRVEQPATYSTVPADAPVTALPPKETCLYDTDNGWRFQIVWPYTIWDDGALDLFLVGNAAPPPGGCSRTSGYNLFETDSDTLGAETHSFVVWDGVNLATILVTGDGSGTSAPAMTKAMAEALGWCERPVLIDWHWEEQTFG